MKRGALCATSGCTGASSSARAAPTRCGPIRRPAPWKRFRATPRFPISSLERSAARSASPRSAGDTSVDVRMRCRSPERDATAARVGAFRGSSRGFTRPWLRVAVSTQASRTPIEVLPSPHAVCAGRGRGRGTPRLRAAVVPEAFPHQSARAGALTRVPPPARPSAPARAPRTSRPRAADHRASPAPRSARRPSRRCGSRCGRWKGGARWRSSCGRG